MTAMDASTAQVVTSICSTVSAVLVAWIGFKVKKLEHSMNSIREELVQTTAAKSHAEGMIAGKAEQKAETLNQSHP